MIYKSLMGPDSVLTLAKTLGVHLLSVGLGNKPGPELNVIVLLLC